MFVDIENFNSALAVENMLTPYKKGSLSQNKKSRLPKEPITPEVCVDVLKSTNYARNIKDMLVCVSELSETEQAPFKDVVLACFDNREQPQTILDLGRELARIGGFEAEFNKTCQKRGKTLLLSASRLARAYIAKDCKLKTFDLTGYDKLIYDGKDKLRLQFMDYLPPIIEAPHCSDIHFEQVSILGVKKIVTNEECRVSFTNLRQYERDVDLSTSAWVGVDITDVDLLKTWKCPREKLIFQQRLHCWEKLLDLTFFDYVEVHESDFEKDTKILFRDGAKFKAYYVRQFPDDVDFSLCSSLETVGCDFQNQPHMKFRKGAKVVLDFARNLPANLDFSECVELDLTNCDLKNYDTLKLAPNIILHLEGAEHLPQNIDFSECAEVSFYGCDWLRQQRPCFKNARKVIAKSMGYTKNLTEASGVENCDELMLDSCDFSNFKSLKPKKGAKVNFRFGQAFPPDMDLSQCAEVVLENANLKGLSGLDLHGAHKVVLKGIKEGSGIVDVSGADDVDMSWADCADLTQIKFKDGAKGNFECCENLNAEVDWSKFSEVKLKFCTLTLLRDMVFRQGADVDMNIATLPEGVLDFSACAKVNLSEAKVPFNTQFIFQNRAQMEESKLVLPKKWKGRICFKDNPEDVIEAKQDNVLSGFFGKLFAKGGR